MGVFNDVRKSIRKASLQALLDYFPTTALQNSNVFFSNVSGLEPVTTYVVINILSIEQCGMGYTSTYTNDDEELTIQANYNIFVQFSFIGSESGDMSQTFSQRVNNVLFREELQRNNLNLRSKTNVRRAPQKRDVSWVEYHNMDVVFTYTVNTQQLVDVVEAVTLVDTSTGERIVIPPDFTINP